MIKLKSKYALWTVACLLLASSPAWALISFSKGNAPVEDQNWRRGAVDVANLKCRVCVWVGPPFGGGMSNFLYRSDTETFNKALKLFAKVRAPSLELIVSDGPGQSFVLKNANTPKSSGSYDWDFVIWDAKSYYHLYGNPTSTFLSRTPDFRRPLPPPRIHVFTGGGVKWDKVRVPDGITVIDKRAAAAGVKPGQGTVIAGNVFDMVTSKPLTGAMITVGRLNASRKYETVVTGQSDAGGRFKIEKVPAGAYRVSVSAKGYASLAVGYPRIVADGYLPLDNIELAPQTTVSGSVVDGAGKPIVDARVWLVDVMGVNGQGYRLVEDTKVKTDAKGRFLITGVPVGFGRVRSSTQGYHGPMRKLSPVPAKDVAIRMSQTGTIKGVVLGKMSIHAHVHVSAAPQGGERIGKWGGSMRVKADGAFQFDNVPAGTYTISTRPLLPGIEPDPNAKEIKVTARQTVTVKLKW